MLKKTIKFKDLDGNELVEDFYFALNKAEIAELELSHPGGLEAQLKRIIAANDGAEIIARFKDLIVRSVGKRSEDGRKFLKSREIADDFMQTDAYSVFFMELVTDAAASAEFVRMIMPADLQDAVADKVVAETLELPDEVPAWISEDREPTQNELNSMTKEQLQAAFLRKASTPSVSG